MVGFEKWCADRAHRMKLCIKDVHIAIEAMTGKSIQSALNANILSVRHT